jgi:hypothetical protein
MDQIEFKVDLKLPDLTVVNIGLDVLGLGSAGVGRIRSSLNPLSRETELSLASIFADNGQGHFSPSHANCLWGTNLYQGSRVRVFSRWRTTQGSVTAWEPAFVGVLDRITLASSSQRAELKVVDALTRLQNLNVPQALEGASFANDSPAHQALKLIGSGYGKVASEFIDTASFEAGHTDEAGAGMTMKKFTLQPGTWFSNLRIMLNHGGSGVRIGRDGKIYYFTWLPDLSTPTIHLRRGENLIDLTGGDQFQYVRNAIKVQRGNHATTPPTPGVNTSGSPRLVTTSIDAWDERYESTLSLTYYDSDAPANLAADRRIDLLSIPPLLHTAVCHMTPDLFPFEPYQRLIVSDHFYGYVERPFTVIEMDASPASQQVTFTLWDNAISADSWLICNRSGHKLDDSYKIW